MDIKKSIAIIGAGYTGIGAAINLLDRIGNLSHR